MGLVLAVVFNPGVYIALVIGVLFLHALFVLWVALGAFLTRSRPVLQWLHVGSLFWGILTEVLPWPCPLTILENSLESRAGVQPYQGSFLLHYLDLLVYPNISVRLLTITGVVVCVVNLVVYAQRIWIEYSRSG